MKVVIDVLGAPAQSGGMRLYAQELVHSWAEEFPDDEIVVVGEDWVRSEFAAEPGVSVVVPPRGGQAVRILAQFVYTGVIFRRRGADHLLSVSSIVSPLVPRTRRASVIHDWRHMVRPDEFARINLLYRRLWPWSLARAGQVLAISEKTAQETEQFVGGRRPTVIENGRDHCRRWRVQGGPPVDATTKHVVTFGHQTNKRPDLVVRAVASLPVDVRASVRLTVLGARGAWAQELAALADALGIGGLVRCPGFVTESEYQATISSARAIVLASSDEGFGLPVVEGNFFGIPVVVTDDSGLAEIHPGLVSECRPTPAGMAACLEGVLGRPRTGRRASDSDQTWGMVARQVRVSLSDVRVPA